MFCWMYRLQAKDYAMLRLIAILFVLAPPASALYIEDNLDNHEPGYQLLTDFCFGSRNIVEAKLAYTLLYPSNYAIQKLFLVPSEQWGQGNYTCTDLKYMLQNAYVIELHPGIDNSGCVSIYLEGEEHYNCTNSVVLSSETPRRWYIAIARCYPSMYGMEGLKLVEYGLHMTNGLSEYEADGCFGDYYSDKHIIDDDDDDQYEHDVESADDVLNEDDVQKKDDVHNEGDVQYKDDIRYGDDVQNEDDVHGADDAVSIGGADYIREESEMSAGTSNNAQWTPAIIPTAAILFKLLL